MIKIPSNLAEICVRLETRQALAWQIALEFDTSQKRVYDWYRFYRGKRLSEVTGHRRGKVKPKAKNQGNGMASSRTG